MPKLSAEDYLGFPRVEPDIRYRYGDDPLQFGELTLPRSAPPHPVVVLVHGGGYQEKYDLNPLGSLVASLADDGLAVWNIEYRRHGNGGDFPQMFLDVGAAADHLRQIADAQNLDLDKVISMGHSAGGHLALWLAARHRIDRSSPLFVETPVAVRAVLALAPVGDIALLASTVGDDNALLTVMGGRPADAPDNYRNGSPSELLPAGKPQTIIVGSEDRDILSNSRAYVEAAKEAGDSPRLTVLPDAGHFEVVHVQSPAWIDVKRAVSQLREQVAT
ncbi:MAG: alpha/beta hydrolase [Chloroflexi bacterium]|nr:alpha/beta hydrolase [Chloroflexota bacterium]